MNTGDGLLLYLVRSEASYTGSIYGLDGLVCFYNNRLLIKVAPIVNIDSIIIITL